MSIMRCEKCERYIDTDFEEYNYAEDCCGQCEHRGPSVMLPQSSKEKLDI